MGLPGAVAGIDQPAAAAGEPNKRRQVDSEACALCPAGVAPAVAQATRGPVAAADQAGELVERDRILLRDQPQQLQVPLGNLEAASVSPPTPLALFSIPGRRCQCFHLLRQLFVLVLLVVDRVCLLRPRSRSLIRPFAPAVRDLPLSQMLYVERGRSRSRRRRRRERERPKTGSVERERGRTLARPGRQAAGQSEPVDCPLSCHVDRERVRAWHLQRLATVGLYGDFPYFARPRPPKNVPLHETRVETDRFETQRGLDADQAAVTPRVAGARLSRSSRAWLLARVPVAAPDHRLELFNADRILLHDPKEQFPVSFRKPNAAESRRRRRPATR